MTQGPKIIFLDIDGVLVNRVSLQSWRSGSRAIADPARVDQLNRIIRETGARIVVSSTWRMGRMVADLREILHGWGVLGVVMDKTPIIRKSAPDSDLVVSQPRGTEIQQWITDYEGARESIQSFVILDDDDDMGDLSGRLVLTNFDAGLTEQDADRAIVLLGEGIRS